MNPSPIDPVFGRWLQRSRKLLDLTQKELARQVGCSAATIRKLEADERRPSKRVAEAVATAVGVPSEERAAFVRFARTGWADAPPAQPRPDLDRPWLATVVPAPSRSPGAGVSTDSVGSEGAPAGPSESPVVGREAELDRLLGAFEEARSGHGRTVLVRGEAGQGKTALLRAAAERAQLREPTLLVALGSCNAFIGGDDPFLPFREVLEQLTGGVPLRTTADAFETTRAARLWQAMPWASRAIAEHGPHLLDTVVASRALQARLLDAGVELALSRVRNPALGATTLPDRDGYLGHVSLLNELERVLTLIADETPLLLILDDLQWTDRSSADLLLQLARNVREHRILVLGAYRPAGPPSLADPRRHPLEPVVHEIGRLGSDAVLDLDRADGRAFLDAWLDSEPNRLGERFRTALFRRTAGQPLFTIELIRALQERGDLARDASGRWTEAATLRWDVLPERLTGVLGERIDRLEPVTRSVLRVASVEGELFTTEVVARVLEREPRAIARELGDVLDRHHRLVGGIDVRRTPRGLVSRYRFHHDLIQRYLYDQLAASERAYLHEAVGQALEDLLGEEADPAALALHFRLANAPERAAIHQRRAGDRARRSAALDEAIDHYQRALASWPPDADPSSLATLHRDLGECRWLRGDLGEAEGALSRAREGLEAAGRHHDAGAVLLTLGRVFHEEGDFDRALAATEEAGAVLGDGPETAELARAQSALSQLHMLASDHDQALVWGERALALSERLGAQDAVAHALNNVGTVLARAGAATRDEGLLHLERSHRLAQELGLPHDACRAAFNLAGLLEALGRIQEAVVRWTELVDYARDHQIHLFELSARLSLGRLEWRRGRWRWARRQLQGLRAVVPGSTGSDAYAKGAWIDLELAGTELDLGRPAAAHDLLVAGSRALDRVREEQLQAPYLRARLRAAAALGRSDEADRSAAQLVDLTRPRGTHAEEVLGALLTAVRWLARRSTSPLRERQIDVCLRVLHETERQYGSADASATTAAARATVADAAGDDAEAAVLWQRAGDLWQASGFPFDEARARCAAGRAHERTGHHGDARVLLERTRTLLDALASEHSSPDLIASFSRVRNGMLRASAAAL
ncbi:MAG: AAA family ATPase [Deinococcales bacterium]